MEKDNINILLVEDEFILAFVEKKELEKRGYVVHHVGTGEQAINFIQNNSVSIHLILMDIDLGPGLDGTKTAEKILRLKDIPIVFLSSHTEPEIVEKTEKITSYGYVVKNTGIVVLDASIKMALKLFNAKLDQLRAEESLKIFSLAVEKSSDAIGISTPDGKHYYQNKAFDLLFGEIENLPSSGLYTDKQLRGTIFDTLKSGNISSNEVKMIDKTGNIIDVMLKAYPIKDSSDKIIGLVGVHTDISENIKAEQALRESEEKLRRLIQHLHAGVVVHAPNTEIILSNDRAAEILGLTLDQMKGKSAIDPNWKFLRGDKSIMPLEEYPVNQVITKHKPIRDQVVGIYRPITDDFVWGQISAFPEFDNEGKLVQVVVTFVDITELNKAKEKIHQQLIEKEVLLKEIIHRVKNNIANIENLLVLQAETSSNEEVKSNLQDAISRIQSLRNLYEKLLLGNDYQEVSMKEYIEGLVKSIKTVFPESQKMEIETIISDFPLSSRFATSVGIIVNELMTNIFKYAFKDQENKKISISLDKNETGFKLIVRDNGIGMDPKMITKQKLGFGLTIIKMLSEQLGGTISLSNDNGAKVEIQF